MFRLVSMILSLRQKYRSSGKSQFIYSRSHAGRSVPLLPAATPTSSSLTALRMASLINEAGFPPGVANILVGGIMSSHVVEKLAFIGSTLVGRKIMERVAQTNLKDVMLELGVKSPKTIFNDADLDLTIYSSLHRILWVFLFSLHPLQSMQ